MNIQSLLTLISILFGNFNYSYNYPCPIKGYYSQKGQDKFLNEQIFKDKKDGFFVEIGAHDGISFSNTYFFERHLNWKGICVEPQPELFQKLINNRTCFCEKVCISDITGQKTFLKCSGYMLEMYSGLLDNYDPRHLERIKHEMELYGGNVETIPVQCITFGELVKKYGASHIDLLSIDVEGGERAIIYSIDFDRVTIDIILIENNFNEEDIKNYLLTQGYEWVEHIGKDDIYQLKGGYEDS